MKNRLTNYNFWISMVSAVLLIFQAFDLQFDIEYINEIVTAVLGLLVVIGIISDPTKSSTSSSSNSSLANQSTQTGNTASEKTKGEEVKATKETNAETINEEGVNENEEIIKDTSTTNENTENLARESLDNAQPNENPGEITAETIPTIKETSSSNDLVSNNFEVLIKQISTDLNKSMSELYKVQESLNKQTMSAISKDDLVASNSTSNVVENTTSNVSNELNQENSSSEPATKTSSLNENREEKNTSEVVTCHNINYVM
ncbi:MAG TPA: hypothetical protein IAB72_03435 [Candidatus Onthoplasma faecipullorum]|nr:hypothetical protein [Candidatus Onthoplasma faecipullorum]